MREWRPLYSRGRPRLITHKYKLNRPPPYHPGKSAHQWDVEWGLMSALTTPSYAHYPFVPLRLMFRKFMMLQWSIFLDESGSIFIRIFEYGFRSVRFYHQLTHHSPTAQHSALLGDSWVSATWSCHMMASRQQSPIRPFSATLFNQGGKEISTLDLLLTISPS